MAVIKKMIAKQRFNINSSSCVIKISIPEKKKSTRRVDSKILLSGSKQVEMGLFSNKLDYKWGDKKGDDLNNLHHRV